MDETDVVTALRVEREVRIDASPEVVFGFLVDPEQVTRWMGAEAVLEARPGGMYRVKISEQAIARGEFTVVESSREVAFTWGWEGEEMPVPPGSSLVTVTLTPDGDGTIVRLVHTGLPTEEMATEHTRGWDHYLDRLAVAATGGHPGPDVFAEGGD